MSPPAFLSDPQVVRWNYVIASSVPGLLKLLDRDVLAAWVVAADLHAQAVRLQTELDKDNKMPLLAKVGGTLQQSPYLPIINRQAQIMKGLASELGFSPSARTRIDLGAAPDRMPNNPFEQY